jgi:hypothetical protein
VIATYKKPCGPYKIDGMIGSHYLYIYSGKDLLLRMEADLQALGYRHPGEFLERALLGIRDAADDVSTWLPEWSALRKAIEAFAP